MLVTKSTLFLMILFVCFVFRACIIIGGCFVLSGSAIISKAVYMLVIDNEPKRVRNDALQQSQATFYYNQPRYVGYLKSLFVLYLDKTVFVWLIHG